MGLDTPETCRSWRNILRISCASVGFSVHNICSYCFLSGVKRPGRGVDNPPTSSAEVKERVELYLYTHSGLSPWYRVNFTVSIVFCGSVSELYPFLLILQSFSFSLTSFRSIIHYSLSPLYFFGRFRKAAKIDYELCHICVSVCLSVCLHGTGRLARDGFL
jgi:hypothetical protein